MRVDEILHLKNVLQENSVLQIGNFHERMDLQRRLTFKAPNKNCSRRHFNFLLLFFKENKS